MTELEQAVAKVALKNPEIIYFNLKNVNYLDSYTITTFIRFVNSFSRDNVKINFYNISPEVESIFKISKVDLFFTILTPEQFDDSSFFTN